MSRAETYGAETYGFRTFPFFLGGIPFFWERLYEKREGAETVGFCVIRKIEEIIIIMFLL
jgi:hypothetical protein